MEYNNRILIVDDTESIHKDFQSVLSGVPEQEELNLNSFLDGVIEQKQPAERPIHYRLDSAYQGKEAYKMVQKALEDKDPYALIFLDVRMPPGWDGITTAEEIWKISPDTEIVICTAYSDYSWDAILDKLGISDRMMFLKKPFDVTTVKQMALSQVRKWNLGEKSRRVMETLEDEVQKRTAQLESSLKALEVSKKVTEDILDSISASVFMVSSDFSIQAINHPAVNYFNIKEGAEQILHHSLFGIIDPYNRADIHGIFTEHLQQLHISGEESTFEVELPQENETQKLVFTVSITRLHSHEDAYLITMYDITCQRKEQKYLQRKQRMESVGLLAGGIAHEFNNIIAGIQGYAQLALKSNNEDLYRRGAEVTERQCKRATELVRGLLTFSRAGSVGSGKVNVAAICEEVVVLTNKNTGAKSIEVVTDLDKTAFVKGEAGPLQQIVMNLIINAQHAMTKTPVKKLTVSVVQEKGSVVLTVSDTGHGIEKNLLPHVFDPFFTTKGALGGGDANEKIHGTGLGLSVVMGIVNDFGGTIEVKSEIGLGTTFTVRLPSLQEKNAHKKILVIDDDLALLKVYTRWIEHVDCSPIVVSLGSEGLDVLEKERPDLILLDQELPDTTGLELLGKIRERDPKVPIVMVTGTVDRAQAKSFLAAGANDCFFKPLNHVKINTILNQYVRAVSEKKESASIPENKECLQGKRILIVDDEPVVRNVYKAICQRSGIEVTEADNGSVAVELATDNEFDMILMDIAMPEMDGVAAIRRIKQTIPYTPIVVCTGFLSDSHKEAYQAGALKIMTKPVGVRDLLATVSEVLCN